VRGACKARQSQSRTASDPYFRGMTKSYRGSGHWSAILPPARVRLFTQQMLFTTS
jgi:hypothetical protein